MRRAVLTIIALALVTTQAEPALAANPKNPKINVQVFRPAAHEKDLFTVLGTWIPEHLRWSVSAMVNFGKNPLVFVDTTTAVKRRQELIRNQLTLDVMGSLALYDWVDIGIAVPVFFLNNGDTEPGFVEHAKIPTFALGDIRLSPKLRIINRKDDQSDGFGLALDFELDLPTGSPNAFVSDGFAFVPTAIVDYKIGPFLAAANLGARIRAPGEEDLSFLAVSHEFLWRVGASYDILPEQLVVAGELYGASSEFNANSTYLEGMIGGRYLLPDDGIELTLGGGSGFVKGYGNTKFRIFAGFQYAPPVVRDQDGDGILDDLDKCPTVPEDKDKFEDEDGCPDLDNDQDGIPDATDRCPMDKEDVDQFEDGDGCPDADNDGDGILDGDDKCPLEAEDKDGFQDEDGCPEPDNDKDGILDGQDKCPNEPETKNGFEDEDGCPDETLAKLEGGKIVIADKIYFDSGKATIKPESFRILDAVAGIMSANTQIKGVRIEGHTDDQGSNKANLKLSQARCESVRNYLVSKGIGNERMTPAGFGEERPAVPGKTKVAREANRRVEFIVLE